MAEGSPRVIRTPDHRLRVFVSSTLQEVLPERRAARAAITRLHLSPVMFELGARPHPPRELYRAYLDQSHIFVGIYWQRYGWVAPGEEISGLEDEYLLCGDRPKLIYVKAPAPDREDRLKGLLKRIQTDDNASYKPFATAAELQRLLADDLALLLTERFEAGLAERVAPVPEPAAVPAEAPAGTAARSSWPRVATALVGRDTELADLSTLVARPDVALVTLLGPGGVGKTRLALAAGQAIAATGRAAFVSLSAVSEPDLVVPAVANALGVVEDADGRSRFDALAAAVPELVDLLVLDNLEQVIGAATDIGALLEACPGLTVIATSRAPLRLAAEHEFAVSELATDAAVELFVGRAQAVRPGFALTEDNRPDVAELTRRLDGLPLAIELAAARARLLTPRDLLRRLDRRLDLLAGGARDLPSRQQTLRATIDWSYQLLTAEEQQVLGQLSVFADGLTLAAAEAVSDPDSGMVGEAGGADVFDRLATLVDNNLVTAYDVADEGRFTLLESIRVYAADRLEASGQADTARARHARYFRGLAGVARGELRGPRQSLWLTRLEIEHDNLRLALGWYGRRAEAGSAVADDIDGLAELTTGLIHFWWIRGHYREGRDWLTRVLAVLPDDHEARGRASDGLGVLAWVQGDLDRAQAAFQQAREFAERTDNPGSLAGALGNLGILAMEQDDLVQAQPLLEDALARQREHGDAELLGPALINLAMLLLTKGEPAAARPYLEEAVEVLRRSGDAHGRTTALINLGEVARATGSPAAAREVFTEALQTAVEIGDPEGIAYTLAGFATLAGGSDQEHDQQRAVRLWAAADALRESLGVVLAANSGGDDRRAELDRLRNVLGPAEFDAATAAGRDLSRSDAVTLALDAGFASHHDTGAGTP